MPLQKVLVFFFSLWCYKDKNLVFSNCLREELHPSLLFTSLHLFLVVTTHFSFYIST